jgi:two-component system response regulator HydG
MTLNATRILIVDDEADTCANLSDIFTDLGYQVDIAHDGLSALLLVKQNAYDVAILDLKMPGMDGLELYRRIRQLSAGTVAIVVTAYASGSTASSILDAGAWKLLSKPVAFPQLQSLVDEAISQPLILVVDDDCDLCDTLWELFRERGYRVSVAHDRPEAIERLNANIQLLIVDLKLPTAEGDRLLTELRESNPEARSILITGHRAEMEDRIEEAITKGANAVCYKPFDVDLLLSTVSKLCSATVE